MDALARRLVTFSSLPGRLRLRCIGSPRVLLTRGRIDLHRRIPTDEGVIIDAWAVRARESSPPRATAVLIHGLWDSKARMFTLAQLLASRGFNVLLSDLRAHGLSGGVHTTWGAHEVRDLLAVTNAFASDGWVDGAVVVVGFSMGGGVAIQYAAVEPRCRGVVALAPVASAHSIMHRLLRLQAPWLGRAGREEVIARACWLAGFDVAEASAERAAERLAVPMEIYHGTFDVEVPAIHGKRICAAAGTRATLYLVGGVGHNSLLLGRWGRFARSVERLLEADGFPNAP